VGAGILPAAPANGAGTAGEDIPVPIHLRPAGKGDHQAVAERLDDNRRGIGFPGPPPRVTDNRKVERGVPASFSVTRLIVYLLTCRMR
jgi:hypothetical protein